LPQIGLAIALVWAAAQALASFPYRRTVLGASSAVLLAALLAVLVACAWRQATFWRNNETLWTHTVECVPRNVVAHGNLAKSLQERGQPSEALEEFRKAAESDPRDPGAHNNFGNALVLRGQYGEAIIEYRAALKLDPNNAKAHTNLGGVLANRGRLAEAIVEYRKAMDLRPDDAILHFNLGNALARSGQGEAAVRHLQTALNLAQQQNDVRLAEGVKAYLRGNQRGGSYGQRFSSPGTPAGQ
jgi:Flp pilus assembly protein TadD